MRVRLSTLAASMALFGAMRLFSLPALAQESGGANLAAVATPSASYTSGDTTVNALNDGYTPRNSRDARHGSYGNWPRTGTE